MWKLLGLWEKKKDKHKGSLRVNKRHPYKNDGVRICGFITFRVFTILYGVKNFFAVIYCKARLDIAGNRAI